MAQKTDPIAVFDSGMGGISVLKEMVRLMPEEDFIYFGDSLHAPYGTKTTEEVRELTIGHIQHFIEDLHAKAIAVACNTATSAAVRMLRQMYPDVPLVGVEPAIKPAVLACSHPRVLVMATPVTLKEEKFHHLEAIYDEQAEIIPLPCPGLMEFVEKGILEGEELEHFLREKISPYLEKDLTGIVLAAPTILLSAGRSVPSLALLLKFLTAAWVRPANYCAALPLPDYIEKITIKARLPF